MRYLHLLRCPRCGGRLDSASAHLSCQECAQTYAIDHVIPLLYWPHQWGPNQRDVTEIVKAFYEEHPFPDYDDFDNLSSLIDKARQSVFARLVDEQIPFGTRVLDCGCGTGQLTNFLGIAHRTVFGTDICLNSLQLGQKFKKENQLERVHFLQMNLFRPVFPEATFDFVICNGVLHHTTDPYLGFQTLSRLVKPGGYLIVGLYHRFGRVATNLRRALFRLTGNHFKFLDPRLRRNNLSKARRCAWFADQYQNPQELSYTLSTVLGWLEPHGLRFIKCIPKMRFLSPFAPNEKLFDAEPPGSVLERGLKEAAMLFRGASEGGFFTVVAQKRS